jgi:phosphatidylinositol alpha-1,6-mannosyltransferase
MRIVVLLTGLKEATGGIESFSRSLVRALDELAEVRGWWVQLLVLNDRAHGERPLAGSRSGRVGYRAFGRRKAAFVGAALGQSLRASAVVVGHVNFAPLITPLKFLRPRLPTFLLLYGIDAMRRLPPLQRRGARWATRMISISASTRDEAVALNALASDRCDIVPCVLEPAFTNGTMPHSRESLSLPSGSMILSVTRLAETYKGIDLALQAMPRVLEQVPDAFYVIVGDGPNRGPLEALAAELGLRDRVVFAGQVTPEILHLYYEACDVFVLPSWREGFGIVFLEAMHHGKPCIGVRAGGVPEVIAEGVTGLLTEPRDVAGLTAQVVRLLQDDRLRDEMGRAGKKRVDREFSFSRFRSRLENALCR